MTADIGTKPLSSTRMKRLKELMGMGTYQPRKETQGEEKPEEKNEKEAEKEEKKSPPEGSEAPSVKEAAQIVRLITLAAALSLAKGEGEEEEESSSWDFKVMVLAYTVMVIVAIVLTQYLWKVGVRMGTLAIRSQGTTSRKHPEDVDQPRAREKENPKEARKKKTMEEDKEEKSSAQGLSAAMPSTPTVQVNVLTSPPASTAINAPQPGTSAPLPGKKNSVPAEPSEPPMDQPSGFAVYTTKYGKVYRTSRDCGYLTSRTTGLAKPLEWCPSCTRHKNPRVHVGQMALPIFVTGWGRFAHLDRDCAHALNSEKFNRCTQCLNTR